MAADQSAVYPVNVRLINLLWWPEREVIQLSAGQWQGDNSKSSTGSRKAPSHPHHSNHLSFFPPLASSHLMLFSKRREGLCFCSECCRSHEAHEWVSLKVSKHGWVWSSNRKKNILEVKYSAFSRRPPFFHFAAQWW